MLTKRIIPCLDVNNGRVVKGVNFMDLRDAGDPVEIAKHYNACGADEIVFLDITASYEERETIYDIVEKTAKEIFIPLTVGGGISSIEQIRKALLCGADKVSLNTAAIKNPALIKEASERFGKQCIVIAIDAKRNDSSWNVYIKGGREDTGIDALWWAKEVQRLGAGEILLTSMDQDGTKSGFDTDLTVCISEKLSIPVIASGGAGSLRDFEDVFKEGKADAALAASLFHYKELTIGELKSYLNKKNIPVRV
ncbi:imidazole glycerol phosphate synthase subunit HisF [Vallitalea okinawensis]|uniref:imidazole glycerol phosphate synthase subunit HisF n=1 Tax=Vallitalea okinawensis TaxID=2078660 RepID=UPI000CFDD1F7|nr:imidazole glycerol phosphate synthase subunit HisF [Vallitalea okinawensis]